MKYIRILSDDIIPYTDSNNVLMKRVATIGTFDGVHRGHREVIRTLLSEAEAVGAEPLVVTFRNHPLSVIAPERTPGMLCSPEEKYAAITATGASCVMLDFTPQMCALSSGEWLCYLRDNYEVGSIVIGYDNTFGCDGRYLSRQDYLRIAEAAGLNMITAPEIEGLSSSAIRRLIRNGAMEQAARMLGRYYTLHGTIVQGNQLGRTIGVPTANLQLNHSGLLLPPYGAYVSEILIPGKGRFRGVTNIGMRPSIDPALRSPLPTVETHILDFDDDIYGAEVALSLLTHIRDEKKFPSLEALKNQIAEDIEVARGYTPLTQFR